MGAISALLKADLSDTEQVARVKEVIQDALLELDPKAAEYLDELDALIRGQAPYLKPAFPEKLLKKYIRDAKTSNLEKQAYTIFVCRGYSDLPLENVQLLSLPDQVVLLNQIASYPSGPRRRSALMKVRSIAKTGFMGYSASEISNKYGHETLVGLIRHDFNFYHTFKDLPFIMEVYQEIGDLRLTVARNMFNEQCEEEVVGRTKDEFIQDFGPKAYDATNADIRYRLLPRDGVLTSQEVERYTKMYWDYLSNEVDMIMPELQRIRQSFKRSLSAHTFEELIDILGPETAMRLADFGCTTMSKSFAESKFSLKLEDHHAFGDRKESLTYLSNLLKKNNNSLTWHDFLDQTGLTQENDKQHYLFFRNIFTHQPKHTVTSQILKNIKTDEVRYPLSYQSYDEKDQNTTQDEQLLIKLDLPPQYKSMINGDAKVKMFFDDVWRDTRMPKHPDCFAWARVSLINEDEWLVDEIQSDFMYGKDGLSAYRAEPEKILSFSDLTVQDFKHINTFIGKLFDNWHQVLLSAIMQAARNNNVKHVHMGDVGHMKEKAYISSANKLNKIYDKLPKDFHFKKQDIDIPLKGGQPSISKPFWTREARVIKSYLKDRLS